MNDKQSDICFKLLLSSFFRSDTVASSSLNYISLCVSSLCFLFMEYLDLFLSGFPLHSLNIYVLFFTLKPLLNIYSIINYSIFDSFELQTTSASI